MSWTFKEKIDALGQSNRHLCIGLDVSTGLVPTLDGQRMTPSEFNERIVKETAPYAAAYKPNIAFYEGTDLIGAGQELYYTIQAIRDHAPHALIILDVKRGDTAFTNGLYAETYFDDYGVDAITAHGYMGEESLKPFLSNRSTGCFVVCRTSNPGAPEMQNLLVDAPTTDLVVPGYEKQWPLYLWLAYRAQHWGPYGCGLVAGATYPDDIARIRLVAPQAMLLIPGVGPQGGVLADSVRAAGRARFLISVSRGILRQGNLNTAWRYFEAVRAGAHAYSKHINSAKLG